MSTPCVYILASKQNGTLYVGVTWDLARRVWEHKSDFVEGFTERHFTHSSGMRPTSPWKALLSVRRQSRSGRGRGR